MKENRLFVQLVRSYNNLYADLSGLLKLHGISEPQFNVLRILRGARRPVTCTQIRGQLITRVPDITRLLDRLQKRGLIDRERDSGDRRIVFVTIRAEGLDLLKILDDPVSRLHENQFSSLSNQEREQLEYLLGKITVQLRS